MTTPIDEERVGTVMREMLRAGAAHRPPVDPSELRSRAGRTALRRLDRKVLVAVAAVAAAVVTLIAVGPLRSGTPPAHSPVATQPTTTSPATSTTTAPTTTTTVPPAAAAALETYVADEARTYSAAAAANGVTARYQFAPFVSDHSAPVADDGGTVAVAAFSYDPGGHPVQVLAYRAGHWTHLAGLAAPTDQYGANSDPSVAFLTQDPVSVADVTGDGRPDFLVTASAADNVPGFVVSQAGGAWRYIPFLGPGAPPHTEVLGRSPEFRGNSLVSVYDNCVPDCAAGQNTTIVWTYQPSTGEFTAPDPPGYIGSTTSTTSATSTTAPGP